MAILLILLTALPTLAQEQTADLSGVAPAALTDEMLAEVDTYVSDAMGRFSIPGATIAIVQNGEIIHLSGFGVRQLGNDSPVTPDTLFMIGSVPKSMTALMIGTLVDEGVLDWDTPVAAILPAFTLADSESSRTVTFRDLLSMRSGLPNFDISLFIKPYSPEQIIESLKDLPLVGVPGEAYAYSNQGYASAGFIAAIATGAQYGDNVYETYAQLMQERVFDPIGMGRITLNFDAGVSDSNVASPHSFDLANGGFSTFPVELEHGGFSIIPAGGTTWSNAEDLARYLITEINHGVSPDGARLISEERLLDTWKPEISTQNDAYYALGWVIKPAYHGLQQIEYGGGNLGYTSLISFLPDANLGVVVLTNRLAGDAFTHAITQNVYETAFGLEHDADAGYLAEEQGFEGMVAQMSGGIEAHVDPATVADYLGEYEHDATVRFTDSGDFVLTSAFGDFPLYGVPGQEGIYVMGLAFGLTVQFAGDGSSLTISAGDSQPPVTIVRAD
jgi:CubicO group peptidase (beta-lactamase class C family)